MKEAIRIEKNQSVVIAILVIEAVTMEENEEIKRKLSQVIEEGGKKIVFDFSGTIFVSSIVLASLIFVLKRARDIGGNMVLCGLKDKVKEIFEVTNLDKVFKIYPTRKEALKQILVDK